MFVGIAVLEDDEEDVYQCRQGIAGQVSKSRLGKLRDQISICKLISGTINVHL